MKTDFNNQLLTSMMDLSTQRQKVLAQNIANSNTPGYVKKELSFSDQLSQAAKSGDIEGLQNLAAKVVDDRSGTFAPNGNNVNITEALTDMNQNEVFHSLAARAYNVKLRILKSAIK